MLRLYQGGWGIPVSGIDLIEPGSESPTPGTVTTRNDQGVSLSASILVPIGGPQPKIVWLVDGEPVAGTTIGTTTSCHVQPIHGSYQVELRVTDATSLVELATELLTSSRSWTVAVEPARVRRPSRRLTSTLDQARRDVRSVL